MGTEPEPLWRRLGRACLQGLGVFARAASVPLALVLAAFAAVLAASSLYSGPVHQLVASNPRAHSIMGHLTSYGPTAAGGAILVASLKDVVKTLPSAASFVREWSLIKLFEPSAALFVAVFGLTLVALSLENLPSVVSQRPAVVVATGQTGGAEGETDGTLATYFVGFDQDATVASVRSGVGPGVDVADAYQQSLRQLASSIQSCAEESSFPARLEVVGIASSSPFDSVSPEESRTLNRDLANLRAENVASVLLAAVDTSLVEVRARRWNDYDEVIFARGFSDRRADGEYDELMGLLNRRVEVQVRRAADCEFSLPLFH